MGTLESAISVDVAAAEADAPSMLPVDPRANVVSPLRPSSTLLAYQPNGSSSPKTPAKMGKSQHLAQIRSLGLLHDLQEYISSVESLAAEQKRELEKVREEKRDMEKYLARSEAHPERSANVVDYSGSEVADLPPRMRALVEDNRGLREMIKKYKYRTQSLEHQASQQQSQVLALAEANERLKQSLAECSRTPAEVEREEALKRQLELKTRQLENLEHSLGVLRAKVDTDSKLYRQNLAAAAREKDALKRQLVAANKALEDREKELRALNVELRKARRGAPPTRAGVAAGIYLPPGTTGAGAEDDDGSAAAAAAGGGGSPAADRAAGPTAAAPRDSPRRDVPEERIRIMLLVVRDEIQVQVPVPVEVPVYIHVPVPAAAVSQPQLLPPPLVLPTVREEEEEDGQQQQPQAEVSEAFSEQAALVSEQGPSAAESSAAPEAEPAAAPAGFGVPDSLAMQLDSEAAPEPSSMEMDAEPEPVSEPTFAGIEPATDTETDPGAVSVLPESTSEVALGAAAPGDSAGDGGAEDTAEGAGQPPEPEQQPPLGGGEATEALEGEASAASMGAGGGGSPHTHSSAPLPVPYSRVAARAMATRVGSMSTKQPHPPQGGSGGTTGGPAAAHRKASNASSLGSGGNGSGKSASLKGGAGSTSRRQMQA
ncbi:hypothetical protein Agub_g3643 [Astrephomene gubernaculifera]|uniref:Lebercilin domain-containing protein n=1 Tax=Astrephomene gubernaculifera TaxID=47775 RepID=A0AAD3HJK6_9CHLO|nr:hypothetical protein Agub_g3643 [Astrephomene gubernaculifera]